MRLAESFRIALKRLRHRPVRSLLLLQGTIWGVGVALLQPAIFAGTREAVLTRATEVGADRVTFSADPTGADPRRLSRDDVPALRAAVERAGIAVTAIAGMYVEHATVVGTGVARDPRSSPGYDVVFGTPDAPAARGIMLAEGRLLDPSAKEAEVVVEGLLAEEIARRDGAVLGRTLLLPDGRSANIVGALGPRPEKQRRANDFGFDTGHPMFKSVTAGLMAVMGFAAGDDEWKRTDRCAYALTTQDRVDWIVLRVAATDVRAAAKAGGDALLARGKPPVVFYPPLFPLLLANELEKFRSITVALFLACLVMGGSVMANVGLLAAMRRAPEIAVHRVEGATKRDVAAQFLAEGAVLAVVGTLVGYGVACGLASVRVSLEPTIGIAWAFPWPEAAIAFVVSLAIGVGACLLPAMRAAGQDPVEGLVGDE